MTSYRLLDQNGRPKRRSAMDALEVLRMEAGFDDQDRAKFYVLPMNLGNGETMPLVQLRFKNSEKNILNCVPLPAAKYFRAIPDDLPVHRRFKIGALQDAVVNGHGRIQLRDGLKLHAMEVEPGFLATEPTPLDWRIADLTLELIGARHYYRSLRDDFSPEERHMVPDYYFLDCQRLPALSLPPLKDIVAFIAQRYREVSSQQVANSLRRFGIRQPRFRPA